MACGPGAIAALGRGFWNRLMGLLTDDRAGVMAVKNLAATSPTSVELSRMEAEQLRTAGRQAQTAASLWWGGAEPIKINPPQVPFAQLYENIDGGEPGKYHFGALIHDEMGGSEDQPIFFSFNDLSQRERYEQLIRGFVDSCMEDQSITFDCHEAAGILELIDRGNRNYIIPFSLVEVIEAFAPGPLNEK